MQFGDTRAQVDCSFWLQGKCNKGPQCPFRHDPAKFAITARPPTAAQSESQEICKYFITTGCARGDACKFRHDPAAKVPVAIAAPAPASDTYQQDLDIELEEGEALEHPPQARTKPRTPVQPQRQPARPSLAERLEVQDQPRQTATERVRPRTEPKKTSVFARLGLHVIAGSNDSASGSDRDAKPVRVPRAAGDVFARTLTSVQQERSGRPASGGRGEQDRGLAANGAASQPPQPKRPVRAAEIEQRRGQPGVRGAAQQLQGAAASRPLQASQRPAAAGSRLDRPLQAGNRQAPAAEHKPLSALDQPLQAGARPGQAGIRTDAKSLVIKSRAGAKPGSSSGTTAQQAPKTLAAAPPLGSAKQPGKAPAAESSKAASSGGPAGSQPAEEPKFGRAAAERARQRGLLAARQREAEQAQQAQQAAGSAASSQSKAGKKAIVWNAEEAQAVIAKSLASNVTPAVSPATKRKAGSSTPAPATGDEKAESPKRQRVQASSAGPMATQPGVPPAAAAKAAAKATPAAAPVALAAAPSAAKTTAPPAVEDLNDADELMLEDFDFGDGGGAVAATVIEDDAEFDEELEKFQNAFG